jgi:hypothetical protein
MMLNDFDEIDKNLVEADYLFHVLREHKEIQQEFDFSPQIQRNSSGSGNIFKQELTDYQTIL